MKDTAIFLSGSAVGLAVASTIYGVFYFVSSPYADAMVSGVTLIGIGLALGGYVMRWRGDRSREVYFMLGIGVGIVVVSFIGAGTGVDPYINP